MNPGASAPKPEPAAPPPPFRKAQVRSQGTYAGPPTPPANLGRLEVGRGHNGAGPLLSQPRPPMRAGKGAPQEFDWDCRRRFTRIWGHRQTFVPGAPPLLTHLAQGRGGGGQVRRPGQAGTRGGWGKLWSRVLTCSLVTFVPVGGSGSGSPFSGTHGPAPALTGLGRGQPGKGEAGSGRAWWAAARPLGLHRPAMRSPWSIPSWQESRFHLNFKRMLCS